MSDMFQSGALTCLICISSVRRSQAVRLRDGDTGTRGQAPRDSRPPQFSVSRCGAAPAVSPSSTCPVFRSGPEIPPSWCPPSLRRTLSRASVPGHGGLSLLGQRIGQLHLFSVSLQPQVPSRISPWGHAHQVPRCAPPPRRTALVNVCVCVCSGTCVTVGSCRTLPLIPGWFLTPVAASVRRSSNPHVDTPVCSCAIQVTHTHTHTRQIQISRDPVSVCVFRPLSSMSKDGVCVLPVWESPVPAPSL